jgi:hypothetical protein
MRSRFIYFANLFSFAVVCGLILGTFLASRTQGSPWMLMMGIALAAWDTFLLASIALIAQIIKVRKLAQICVLGALIALVQICAVALLGYTNYLQQMDDTQAYGQTLVHQLEQYKAQHGRYPETIYPATMQPAPPQFTNEQIVYTTTGDRFLLTFLPSDTLPSLWLYDSTARHWQHIGTPPQILNRLR